MTQFIEKRYGISGVSIVLLGFLFVISNLFAGFFNSMGSDIYNTSKQVIQNSTIASLQIIGIFIVLGGFSLMGYGYLRKHRTESEEDRIIKKVQMKQEQEEIERMESDESPDPRRQRENEDKFSPSNIR